MDWFVLLTPLLALVVVALLGYTGCDRIFNLEELPPPPPPPPPVATLLLQTRVPTTVPVTLCRYRFRPPLATGETVEPANESVVDGSDTLYQHRIDGAIAGTWTFTCRLEATNPGGSTVERTAPLAPGGTFVLDPVATPDVVVNWATVGRPGDGQAYQLVYSGPVPA